MRVAPVLFLLSMAVPAAAAPIPPVPPVVQTSIDVSTKDCSGPVSFDAGFVSSKDVNGDGIKDYIVDYSKFVCDGSHTYFCGSAGCLTEVYASKDDGFVKVLGENVRGLRFARINGRPAMIMQLHGSACGKAGAEACGVNLFWTGKKFSPAR